LTLVFDLHIRHVTDGVVNVTGEVTSAAGQVASLEFVFAQATQQSVADNLKLSSASLVGASDPALVASPAP
jgi:hypothetical protein